MGILSWLFKKRSKKYDSKRIDRSLGVWQPFDGNSVIPGTKLPKEFTVPESLRTKDSEFSQIPFRSALFPYWLRISTVFAGFLLKKIDSGEMYSRKEIPREGKSPRVISVPAPLLKFVQRRILSRILEQTEVHPAAHGFVKGRSIFTAAAPHAAKRVVLSMDLRDFFGTISFRRVVGMFKSYGFEKKHALMLAGLCCLENKLPQGAPTSPAISNIICRRLDSRLSGLSGKHGFHYTRYADDLIFSGGEKILRMMKVFKEIIAKEGFVVAEEKTFIRRSGSRQRVLGLNVNTKVSVPRKARRLIRSMVHKQSTEKIPDGEMIPFLLGHCAFMSAAHPEQAGKLKKILKKLM